MGAAPGDIELLEILRSPLLGAGNDLDARCIPNLGIVVAPVFDELGDGFCRRTTPRSDRRPGALSASGRFLWVARPNRRGFTRHPCENGGPRLPARLAPCISGFPLSW